ncbi:MAG: tRNA epoxyqueuosine(34) reductase QueG [Planctomycetota bacterium]
MTESPVDAEAIRSLANDLGFALCRVAPARPSDYPEQFRRWIDAAKHGSMDWLARNTETRLDPTRLLPGAQSVIVVADHIGPPPPELTPRKNESADRPRGRVARYAQLNDYHKIIKKRLHTLVDTLAPRAPGHRFKACVDTAPLLEREHAMRAGLGWVGKHTLLIHPGLGSHLLLGEIVTTLPLETDEPQTDHCGNCTACIDACPTDCITPYSVDATRCVSYLTIEHRDEIEPTLHKTLGDWVFGCDICQDVCPHNRGTPQPPTPPEYRRDNDDNSITLDLLDVLAWDEDARRAAFIKSPMKRAKLGPIKRNALIAAGNHLKRRPNPDLRRQIERLAENPNEQALVRQTAISILNELDK